MKAETIAALQDARSKRRAVTLATRLSDAAEALVFLDKAEGALAGDAAVVVPPRQSVTQALWEAFGHRSYVLLVLGFFTCGFQLAFVTVHLPAYLIDRGLSAWVGGWTSPITSPSACRAGPILRRSSRACSDLRYRPR